jgi:hypothetical protein
MRSSSVTAPWHRCSASGPMKKCIAVLLVLLFLVAGCVLLGEHPISLSDFKKQLNNSQSISIVEDTRNSPSLASVINCGTALNMNLARAGKYELLKNRTFVYYGDQCAYGAVNSSIQECESLISNSTVFYIRYNQSKNSTVFYTSKAVIEGDENFLADCSISRLIG